MTTDDSVADIVVWSCAWLSLSNGIFSENKAKSASKRIVCELIETTTKIFFCPVILEYVQSCRHLHYSTTMTHQAAHVLAKTLVLRIHQFFQCRRQGLNFGDALIHLACSEHGREVIAFPLRPRQNKSLVRRNREPLKSK